MGIDSAVIAWVNDLWVQKIIYMPVDLQETHPITKKLSLMLYKFEQIGS